MSHHSGIESGQKNLTKSQNEAVLNEGGGNVTITDSNVYMAAGGNFGDIQHKDFRKSITALKVADNGSTFTATEDSTRSTLAVQTPPGNTSAEESLLTSGATGARPKQALGEVKLSESIWLFKKVRLARKADVYEGVQKFKEFPDKQLAIKCFWNYTEKNLRGAKNFRKLQPHTNVVSIAHADVYKGMGLDCLYIAMEKCDTLNLEDYIEKRRAKNVPFCPNEAFDHAKQVIAGIDHIHGDGIFHRDLKPSSVLFSICGRYLKICDFGISKQLKNGQTMTAVSTKKPGTDGYRAPETYHKDKISKMADIFSLALVLYHLLSYGFHPFGIDPTSWGYKIKNGQKKGKGPDLSRLRDPFLKIVKELLQQMLNFEPKDRLTIEEVKNSDCMNLDWRSSLMENLVPIWNGVVKDHAGTNMLSCRLYRSPSLQDVIEIDESGWKFQMNTVPHFHIGQNVTDEEPSGYIVTTKDELKKLTDKLTGNLMAWIDISKDGNQSKAIVLLFQPGYPELFGYFFPDTKILTSLIRNLASKQRSTPQKPAADPETRHFASAQSSNSLVTLETPNLQAQSSEPSSAESASVSTSGIVDQDPIKEQEAASARNQWKQKSRDLIPWWIFTGDFRK